MHSPLNVVNKYKYLGVILEEHLDFNLTASVLANATGLLISKFNTLKHVGFSTFSKMYHSCVVPITDYSPRVWRYLKSVEDGKIQNRVRRFYLWVHKKAPIWAI